MKDVGQIFRDGSFDILEGAGIILLWDKVVEGPVKKNCRALKFVRGSLYVEVSSSVWANELNFLKKNIIDKLNDKSGRRAVKDIKFLVKGVSYAEEQS